MSSLFDLPFDPPEPPDAEPEPAATARRVLSVGELTARVRGLLEQSFFEVWVEGELSNCRVWNTGHLYFTLKDRAAQIRGVMFRSSLARLRFKPQDGLRVVARGRITVYDVKGEYQILCEHLEPEGLGARQLAFDQLKTRLAAEGLFDARRKRALPALPRKIGLVTSLDGAAVRDILNVLRRRYANAHVVIRPCRVQGQGAALEVARALRAIAQVPGVDVVIVGRGGGSIEDLWAFNEEVVARAIAGCPMPTIAAIGHETDVTIADFVADVRAPTPSAAAEMVVVTHDDFCANIDRLTGRLDASIRSRLHRIELRLRALEARPGYAGVHGRIAMRAQHTSELTHSLRRAARVCIATRERTWRSHEAALAMFDPRRRLAAAGTRLVTATARLDAAVHRHRHTNDARLRSVAARLEALSPLAVLGRGYAVCWDADRTRIIRDAGTVREGDSVAVTLQHGALRCQVTERLPEDDASEPSTGT